MSNGDHVITKCHCGTRSSTQERDEEDWYYSQKMPAVTDCLSNRLVLDEKAKALASHAGGTTTTTTTIAIATIEVSPGEYLRLRGAEETWRAIRVDFCMPSECICCTLTLFCIQDAAFVLCPACRVISPMTLTAGGAFQSSSNGGVGLGFTMSELAKWQGEMQKFSN
jgi:hypothetical protein